VQLVQRARAGDTEAFAFLAAEQLPSLRRFCGRLMGDEDAGRDLAQDTLLRAQQSIQRLGEPYRFGPWLMGIAANLAKKAWRAELRRPLSLEVLVNAYPNVPWDESHTDVASPERRSEEAEEARLLLESIRTLPKALGRVVVLHYLNGLSYAEVAGVLDLPVSTVKGRLFDSRTRLRHALRTRGVRVEDGRQRPNGEDHRGAVGEPHDARQIRRTTGGTTMEPVTAGRHIRVEVDVPAVVDEAHRFVASPWPRRQPAEVLEDLASSLNRFVPLAVLEYMVLDGIGPKDRQAVAEFVESCFADWGLRAAPVPPMRNDSTSAPWARVQRE
jgi:RNA polymerase sigma-70 factor (ECF subfamily)